MASLPSPGPSVRPDPAEAVTRIALRIAATPMAQVDVATVLSGMCAALPPAVGVAGAALVLSEPADPRDTPEQQVFASDEVSARLGMIQHRAGRGPVPAAVRGDRPLVVPDLTVSGPPELAAAAADCGLVRSLVVPVPGAGQPVGGLQLLAGAGTALDETLAEPLRPLVAVLAARLADLREMARLQRPGPEQPGPGQTPAEQSGTPELHAAEPDANARGDAGPVEETLRLTATPESADPRAGAPDGEPAALFVADDPDPDTPPIGQAELGWEGPEFVAPPTPLPVRPLPARVQIPGRPPRPRPAAVPAQRTGPAVPVHPEPAPAAATSALPVSTPDQPAEAVDDPTWRVPRHRLRDD